MREIEEILTYDTYELDKLDKFARRRRNRVFANFESFVSKILKSEIIHKNEEVEIDCTKITEEYRNLVSKENIKKRIDLHFKKRKFISKSSVYDLLKKEISYAARVSKMKELSDLYQNRIEELEEEQKYYDSLEKSKGLSEILDYIKNGRFVLYSELQNTFNKKGIHVREILWENDEYFYQLEEEDGIYISLSGRGLHALYIRDKRAEKKYSQSELEDEIFKKYVYILDCLLNNTEFEIAGMSSERQKTIQEQIKKLAEVQKIQT